MFEIIQANSEGDIDAARTLFREYESWLGLDLCFQGFEEEMRTLPGRYAFPEGRLLLAMVDGNAAGCIGLRKLEKEICEMKRLFVRDEFRGRNIGPSLIERLIADARSIGYKRMMLDTLPSKMAKAVDLYRSFGFRETDPYYENPYDDVLFLELELEL